MTHPATSLLTLSYADVMRLVDPAAAMAALAEGFQALSRGEVQAPPRPKVEIPGKGYALAMLAWMPGQLISLKTVNVFEANHARGLESHQATISLFDAETGAPVALLDGAGITGLRTAASALLSVRACARPDARIATVVGAGVQGREHVRLMHLAGTFDEIRVVARSPEAAQRAADMAFKGAGGARRVRVVEGLEAAVRGADVVCLTTGAASPVIEADWIAPGTHVTSVGFAPPGSEVPAALVAAARVIVEAKSAFLPAPAGCVELAGRDATSAVELGEVLAGSKPGRRTPQEITLYKSMGNAMEDMMVANLAYRLARAAGAGAAVTL